MSCVDCGSTEPLVPAIDVPDDLEGDLCVGCFERRTKRAPRGVRA